MNAKQYRDALRELGWTQAYAATILGFHERTSRKYALGESPISATVERLLLMHLRIARDLTNNIDDTGILP